MMFYSPATCKSILAVNQNKIMNLTTICPLHAKTQLRFWFCSFLTHSRSVLRSSWDHFIPQITNSIKCSWHVCTHSQTSINLQCQQCVCWVTLCSMLSFPSCFWICMADLLAEPQVTEHSSLLILFYVWPTLRHDIHSFSTHRLDTIKCIKMAAYWLNVITFWIHCATAGLVSTRFVYFWWWGDSRGMTGRWYSTRTQKGLIPVSLAVILGL